MENLTEISTFVCIELTSKMGFKELLLAKKGKNNLKNNLKDPSVFDTSCYLSTDLVFERKELHKIGEQFLEFIQEDCKRHLAILGSKGSGKTVLVRFAMKELEKSFDIKWYYVNCAEADTPYKIAKRILGEKKRLDLYKALNNLLDLINSKEYFKNELKIIRKTHNIFLEFKWKKVVSGKIKFYTDIIDFFFRNDIRFRCILLPTNDLDVIKFHESDNELMFYKFYYQLLHHWILDFNEYMIFLDLKTNRLKNRIN
jgi:Cdc6-like AAA superfamily ATPase